MRLFFDLETVPYDDENKSVHELVASEWRRKKRLGYTEDDFETFAGATALSGDFGRIACMSWAVDGEKPQSIYIGQKVEGGTIVDERPIINKWWELVRSNQKFIGHNIFDFDLPFLIKRSRIHRIEPSKHLSLARYRNDPIYDTMQEWSCWGRGKTSLDVLSQILGIKSPKSRMDGSDVAGAFAEGRHKKIANYCERDVTAVREVYRRLIYAPFGK